MLLDLPASFPVRRLDQIDLGSVEASRDDVLLKDPLGFCEIHPIRELLKDKTSVIVGTRGTGKTAIFRLLSLGQLRFAKRDSAEQVLIPIQEEVNYKVVSSYVLSRVATTLDNDVFKYRIIWEVFILYRLLLGLASQLSAGLSEPLVQIKERLEQAFDMRAAPVSLVDLLKSLKYTLGVTLNPASPVPVPDVYISSEPSENIGQDFSTSKYVVVALDEYKRAIQSFLHQVNVRAYVLVDRIDEFVVRADYDSQRLLLQGLLECSRDYERYERIQLKFFIREDLFERLDFGALSYDKVVEVTTFLQWSASDIRRFIAQRLATNLMRILDLRRLSLTVEEKRVYVDAASAEICLEIRQELLSRKRNDFLQGLSLSWGWIRSRLPRFLGGSRVEPANHIAFTDEVSRQVIASVFPPTVRIGVGHGSAEEVDLFDFLERFFCLSTDQTTPRIMVQYLRKCFERARVYYSENPDKIVELTPPRGFPLISGRIMREAYEELKADVWSTLAKLDERWRPLFERFRAKRRNRVRFTFAEFRSLLRTESETELRQFLALLTHLGVLKCENPKALLEARCYSLPILFL